jgi:protein O-mannosyl-transferase
MSVPGAGRSRAALALAGAGLLALAFASYLPCLHGGVLWNDPDYLTSPSLASLHGLFRIWFEVGATQQYYPLLHSAFWVEHRLWGDSMVGYHAANVVLHAGVACLFGLVLRRLGVPGAGLAAAVFVVHPVFVESVAWVTEQKNTLSGVFFLGAALAYLRFDDRRSARGYALALALFACAVLCKTVTAPLPAALLVVFWWRRGGLSWKRDVVPLIPWFAVGAAGGLFSAWVETRYIGASGAPFALSLAQRFLVSGRVIWFYLGKLLWPVRLNFIYPRWDVDAASVAQYAFPAAAMALAAGLWAVRGRSRAPLAALLLFAGLLFPVMGYLNVYSFVYSFVADHFQYLPAMPVIALLCAGAARVARGARMTLGGGVLVAVLALLSWRQCGRYTDLETFYVTMIRGNPDCWMAYNNLGILYQGRGRPADALAEYGEALRIHPGAQEHYNIGIALADEGRLAEALTEFDDALRLRPAYPDALYNRAVTLGRLGRISEAIEDYQATVQMSPQLAEAHSSLGFALAYTGRANEGIEQCREAVRLSPGSRNAHFNLGFALAAAKRFGDAVPEYRAAAAIDPGFPEARYFLGVALEALGRVPEAAECYAQALQLRPGYAEAAARLKGLR